MGGGGKKWTYSRPENDFRIQNTKFVTNDSKATVSVPFLIYSLR